MTRKTLACALPIVAALPLMAAYFGGWAVITVETLPEYILAGQPTNLTFSVRQHGVHLLGKLEPRIDAELGKRSLAARAVPTNREGYYTATLRLPEPGAWTLTVHSGFMRSEVHLLPIPVVTTAAQNVALSDGERGKRLFVAKGCVTCHTNGRVAGSGGDVGPDLTTVRFTSDYLREYLANPQIRPPTTPGRTMPNLNLKPNEIESLVTFLNGSPASKVSVRD